jgi:chromate transporter
MLPTPPALHNPEAGEVPGRLLEVARVFAKVGLVGFGGPAAHVALMEDEVVRRRGSVARRSRGRSSTG